ncbi:hypothetical protein SAMD00023353_1000620 [Rosellinia necatrix]|uniref:2EXR domain-containing protein n=1 Tax=Rosellinia necatrix TaxID=77044 RepID=A0A1W2TBZ3_ROSNE|nr:hypothetical protein SAMD00023353_1000620 [Rosellinia necatrix]
MAMQWFMNRFSASHGSDPVAEQEDARTFHLFPNLPTELRLQIWEYYFDAPRIHVLYQGPSRSQQALDKTPVAYTDLTAGTNQEMSASRRYAAAAINHEALEIFRKTFDLAHMDFMSLPSKHVRDLFDDKLRDIITPEEPDQRPSIPKHLLQSSPGLAEFVRNPSGKPRDMVMPGIHINWERDLLYLTDGVDVNCEMLRRACNGPIANKLRRVAILIHDSYKYEGWRPFYGPSVGFPKPSAQLAEVVLVVRLDDLESPAHDTVNRDEFGFAPYDLIIQGQKKDSWEWTQNMKLIERRFVYAAQVLREAFPDLEDHKIKWAVDIDYVHHKAETQYSRKFR